MAKPKRGRYVEVDNVRVKSKGEKLELTFRLPAKAICEAFPHIERFVKRWKGKKAE